MPLPAYTTICFRISNLQFFPGIQAVVMDWMQAKLKNLNSFEKVCALTLDEVQISKAYQYDPGLKQFVGYISKEFDGRDTLEAASHVLCFTVKGVALHWKQIVGKILLFHSK